MPRLLKNETKALNITEAALEAGTGPKETRRGAYGNGSPTKEKATSPTKGSRKSPKKKPPQPRVEDAEDEDLPLPEKNKASEDIVKDLGFDPDSLDSDDEGGAGESGPSQFKIVSSTSPSPFRNKGKGIEKSISSPFTGEFRSSSTASKFDFGSSSRTLDLKAQDAMKSPLGSTLGSPKIRREASPSSGQAMANFKDSKESTTIIHTSGQEPMPTSKSFASLVGGWVGLKSPVVAQSKSKPPVDENSNLNKVQFAESSRSDVTMHDASVQGLTDPAILMERERELEDFRLASDRSAALKQYEQTLEERIAAVDRENNRLEQQEKESKERREQLEVRNQELRNLQEKVEEGEDRVERLRAEAKDIEDKAKLQVNEIRRQRAVLEAQKKSIKDVQDEVERKKWEASEARRNGEGRRQEERGEQEGGQSEGGGGSHRADRQPAHREILRLEEDAEEEIVSSDAQMKIAGKLWNKFLPQQPIPYHEDNEESTLDPEDYKSEKTFPRLPVQLSGLLTDRVRTLRNNFTKNQLRIYLNFAKIDEPVPQSILTKIQAVNMEIVEEFPGAPLRGLMFTFPHFMLVKLTTVARHISRLRSTEGYPGATYETRASEYKLRRSQAIEWARQFQVRAEWFLTTLDALEEHLPRDRNSASPGGQHKDPWEDPSEGELESWQRDLPIQTRSGLILRDHSRKIPPKKLELDEGMTPETPPEGCVWSKEREIRPDGTYHSILKRICGVKKQGAGVTMFLKSAGKKPEEFPGVNIWECVPGNAYPEQKKRYMDRKGDNAYVKIHSASLTANFPFSGVVRIMGVMYGDQAKTSEKIWNERKIPIGHLPGKISPHIFIVAKWLTKGGFAGYPPHIYYLSDFKRVHGEEVVDLEVDTYMYQSGQRPFMRKNQLPPLDEAHIRRIGNDYETMLQVHRLGPWNARQQFRLDNPPQRRAIGAPPGQHRIEEVGEDENGGDHHSIVAPSPGPWGATIDESDGGSEASEEL